MSKKDKVKFRLNISGQFILYLVGVSVLPLLVLGIFAYSVSFSIIRNQVYSYTTELVRNQRDYLDVLLQEVESLISNVSGVEEITNNVLSGKNTPDNAYTNLSTQARIGYILNNYINVNGLISIDIYTEGGRHYHVGDTLRADNINKKTKDEIFAKANKTGGDILWTGVEDNINIDSTHKKVITAAKVFNQTDPETGETKAAALLVVNYDIESLRAHFSKIQFGEGAYLMVIDTQNRIIYHPNPDLVGSKVNTDFMDRLTGAEGTLIADINGSPMIVTYTRSENSLWTVASFIPVSNLRTQTVPIATTTIVVLFISFGVVSYLTLRYNRSLVLPVRQITSTFKKYEEGGLDLSTRLKNNNREDEIGELVTWFNNFLESRGEKQRDEEALRESRDKLSSANAALEIASRLKDEFLASMSHELRTPLTGILGHSEALQLQTYGALTEKQLKSVKNIETSGRHLLELINDILDLSKIEAGKLDMQLEPCAVADFCQASLQLTKGMAHQKKINISFSIDPASINVRADPRRLKQMLVNLLSNAVKFTPEGGNMGLEVQAVDAKKAVFLSVWDKGIGIKPEEMEKLFKPFTQIDSSLARQYAGTGLGLSLVQRMAELHGGSIKVESTFGEGSRFTIILPWSADVNQPSPHLKQGDISLLKTILIIEDNRLDVEHVTRYIKELGIASVVQPTIYGALEQAATLRPSAILLDLNLPDGFGLDLLTQLKADKRTHKIPVIVTSVEEQRTEAMELGALGYLLKPFKQQDLRTELAKAATFNNPKNPVITVSYRNSAPLILIADDNEMIIELVSDFLEVEGYRVVATRSGFELLERAPELHPDIMLVDIQMPGLDGVETIRRIRAHSNPMIASVPVIAVTALAMSGDREKCLRAGANEYMSKPIVLTQLVEQIQILLKKQVK